MARRNAFVWGGQARERSGREELTTNESEEVYSCDEIYRKREDYLAEEHFTLTARKAAEVNEGGVGRSDAALNPVNELPSQLQPHSQNSRS